MSDVASLFVFLYGQRIGRLERTDRGSAFEYEDAYSRRAGRPPLSLRMPLSTNRHEDGHYKSQRVVENYLLSLLPDDSQVRAALAQEHGTQADALSLLASPIGLDCAGAVQFSTQPAVPTRQSRLEPVSESDLRAFVRDAQSRKGGYVYGPQPRRRGKFSALAGMHAKFALRRDDGAWFDPHGEEPSTHIIKPDSPATPQRNQAFAEHLTMLIARNAGLDVASTEFAVVGGAPSIVVERYDRALGDSGYRRIHQEDLASAAGLSPDDKYGGVVEDAAGVLRKNSSDVVRDIDAFIDGFAFNAITGGTDAHIKNYSVLLAPGLVRFAPLYDLTSYFPYIESDFDLTDARQGKSVTMSMPLGERHHFGAFTPEDVAQFAQEVGRGDDVEAVARRINALAEKVPGALDRALQDPSLPSDLVRWVKATRLVELVDHCADNATESAQGRPPRRLARTTPQTLPAPSDTNAERASAGAKQECALLVASTGLPCHLVKNHGGNCRSR